MVDDLKASARSTAAIRSPRTFNVSNFIMPETDIVELSAEEVEKKNKKKRSGNKKAKVSKKVEIQSPKRKFCRKKEKTTGIWCPR